MLGFENHENCSSHSGSNATDLSQSLDLSLLFVDVIVDRGDDSPLEG